MRQFFLLCGCIFTVFVAKAQISLDNCQRLAKEHYPAIRQYDLIRQSEQYTLSNISRGWLPQLSLSAQATLQSEVPSLPEMFGDMLSLQGVDMIGISKDQYKISLDLYQPIWDGGRSKVESQIAKTEALEQTYSTDVEFYELKKRVSELFFGILLCEEKITQSSLTIELLESNLEKLRSYRRNGIAMQSDVDIIEAHLLSAKQQLTQLEATKAVYRQMLDIFLGGKLGTQSLIRPDISLPKEGEILRPELSLLEAKTQRLSLQEKALNVPNFPQFGLFANGFYGYPGFDFFKSMTSSDWSFNAMVGVKMSWNISSFNTKANSKAKIRTAKQQIETQKDIFLFNTQMQIAKQRGDIERLEKMIENDRKIIALRHSVRQAAESKLRNGVINTDDLLNRITEEASARAALSVREIELLKTIYELKHTINK